MMNELEVKQMTISSLEVAEMLEIKHYTLLEKLEGVKKSNGTTKQKGIIPILTDQNFLVSDYFIEDIYKDASGKINKCYQFTKLGCDFIANKFTGEKGIIFTAKYVKRFNDMEIYIKKQDNNSLVSCNVKIYKVEQRVENLENCMTIDYEQQNELRLLGNKVAVKILGGYESPAYKEMGKKIFYRLWKDYKIYFKVNSYRNTPRIKYSEAQEYILNWQPDTNTRITIKNLNISSQQALEVGELA